MLAYQKKYFLTWLPDISRYDMITSNIIWMMSVSLMSVHTLAMDFTQRDIYSSLKKGLRYTYESGVAGLSDG